MTTKMRVPFFDYPGLYAEHEPEFKKAIERCLKRGAYIMQEELAEFERNLASYIGVRHAIGVADGTMALIIALKLAEIGLGDEVIVPSHTFIATAAAVKHVGATPVICDCQPDHTIDLESARRVITDRTKAIMPVQLNGRICDMDEVSALAREFNLTIVEDSCQALGAKYKDKFAGTFGIAGSFSFYPAKVLGCFGDGGALIVNDDELATIARQYRDHGRDEKSGKVIRFGHNARLDNLQAAILNVKLTTFNDSIVRRREISRMYHERLISVPEILLPPGPDEDNDRFDIFQNYEIEVEERDALRNFLAERGVGTIIQWGGYLIHQFDSLSLRYHAPYAEAMSKRYMLLPMHHLLSDAEVEYVIDCVMAFYGRKGRP